MGSFTVNPGAVSAATSELTAATSSLDGINSDISSGMNLITSARGSEYLSNVNSMEIVGCVSMAKNSIASLVSLIDGKIAQIQAFQQESGTATGILARGSSTFLMANLKAVEGVGTAVEQVVDGAASLTGMIVGIFSEKRKEAIGNWVKKDHVGNFFYDQYENGYLKNINMLSYMNHDGTAANVLKGVGVAGGYVGMAMITGGTSAAIGGTSVTAGAMAGAGSTAINTGLAFLGGTGSGTQSALQSGKSYNKALKFGLGTGAIQGGTVLGMAGLGKVVQKAPPAISKLRGTSSKTTALTQPTTYKNVPKTTKINKKSVGITDDIIENAQKTTKISKVEDPMVAVIDNKSGEVLRATKAEFFPIDETVSNKTLSLTDDIIGKAKKTSNVNKRGKNIASSTGKNTKLKAKTSNTKSAVTKSGTKITNGVTEVGGKKVTTSNGHTVRDTIKIKSSNAKSAVTNKIDDIGIKAKKTFESGKVKASNTVGKIKDSTKITNGVTEVGGKKVTTSNGHTVRDTIKIKSSNAKSAVTNKIDDIGLKAKKTFEGGKAKVSKTINGSKKTSGVSNETAEKAFQTSNTKSATSNKTTKTSKDITFQIDEDGSAYVFDSKGNKYKFDSDYLYRDQVDGIEYGVKKDGSIDLLDYNDNVIAPKDKDAKSFMKVMKDIYNSPKKDVIAQRKYSWIQAENKVSSGSASKVNTVGEKLKSKVNSVKTTIDSKAKATFTSGKKVTTSNGHTARDTIKIKTSNAKSAVTNKIDDIGLKAKTTFESGKAKASDTVSKIKDGTKITNGVTEVGGKKVTTSNGHTARDTIKIKTSNAKSAVTNKIDDIGLKAKTTFESGKAKASDTVSKIKDGTKITNGVTEVGGKKVTTSNGHTVRDTIKIKSSNAKSAVTNKIDDIGINAKKTFESGKTKASDTVSKIKDSTKITNGVTEVGGKKVTTSNGHTVRDTIKIKANNIISDTRVKIGNAMSKPADPLKISSIGAAHVLSQGINNNIFNNNQNLPNKAIPEIITNLPNNSISDNINKIADDILNPKGNNNPAETSIDNKVTPSNNVGYSNNDNVGGSTPSEGSTAGTPISSNTSNSNSKTNIGSPKLNSGDNKVKAPSEESIPKPTTVKNPSTNQNTTPTNKIPSTNNNTTPNIKVPTTPNTPGSNTPTIESPVPSINTEQPTINPVQNIKNPTNTNYNGNYTGNTDSIYNPVIPNLNQTPATNISGAIEGVTDSITNTVGEVIKKGNTYTKIPVSSKPLPSSSTSNSSVIPVIAGLGLATAAGIGAKAYLDRKNNNDNEYEEESNETVASIMTEDSNNEVNYDIDYTSGIEKEEILEDNNYSPLEEEHDVSKYSARSNDELMDLL